MSVGPLDGDRTRYPDPPGPSPSNPNILPAWFAVATQPRYEKKVDRLLKGREVEAYLPTYSSKRSWKNRQTVTLDLPLFPSYIFARIHPQQRGSVLSVPGVVSIVGGPRSFTPISDSYIETLRTGLALRRILPHAGAEIGDRVRIVTGPFAGVHGVLVQLRSQSKVVVEIETIHQFMSLEIADDEIEIVARVRGLGARP